MSREYDEYIWNHKKNVDKAYQWLRENLPALFKNDDHNYSEMGIYHDQSKFNKEEYDAYDAYFYGGNRSYQVVENFKNAWLMHIHNNPHHWQHWVLINDDPKEGMVILDMPYHYIIEMICDWWAFSWAKGDLYSIFDWVEEHKNYMKLSDKTRFTVNVILGSIKEALDKEKIES